MYCFKYMGYIFICISHHSSQTHEWADAEAKLMLLNAHDLYDTEDIFQDYK